MIAWNVVKKYAYAFFKNNSDDMAGKVGVFIRTTKSNDDIIEACNNLIRKSDSGGRITAVKNDKKYGGVKVYLNGDNIAHELIGKQFLFETGEDLSTIHPLTTQLTVYDGIFSTTEEEFIKELQKIIAEALGPVLKITKIPVSNLHPDIGNGNWRVLLDVPEIEDLDVYVKSGLPDNLTVKVPGVSDKSAITFHCTKCDKDGHTQWRCSGRNNDSKPLSDSTRRENRTTKSDSKASTSSGFLIRDREEESKKKEMAPKNKPLLKTKRIREFESEIGKEEVLRNYWDSDAFKGKREDIKQEVGESSSSGMKRRLPSGIDDAEVNPKRVRISPMIDDDNHSENLPKASSTTNDVDSLEILYESTPSSSSKNQHNLFASLSVGGLFTRNSADDSVSTSNQPAPPVDTIKSELPSTDENDSDSNQSLSRPKPVRQRKKPAQGIPIVIPDRIKNIISEIEDGVCNVEQLTAFFNHVKKKSRPCSFAEIYTRDVAGLKRQLDEIKRRYYMIPERGTNAEIQFMKWFVNILDRFDGTPSTRKKKAPSATA